MGGRFDNARRARQERVVFEPDISFVFLCVLFICIFCGPKGSNLPLKMNDFLARRSLWNLCTLLPPSLEKGWKRGFLIDMDRSLSIWGETVYLGKLNYPSPSNSEMSVGLQGSCILILDPDRFDLTVGSRQRLFSCRLPFKVYHWLFNSRECPYLFVLRSLVRI
jgi:hypothetical protein